MFVKIETEGPDKYGQWRAVAKTANGDRSLGIAETEDKAIRDAKNMFAVYCGVAVDEVIQDGGVIRKDSKERIWNDAV